MKKILIALIVLLALTGCSNGQKAENSEKEVEKQTIRLYDGDFIDLYDEETQEKIKAVFTEGVDNSLMALVGTELPATTFTGYDGNEYVLPENKTYVFEIVGSWCSYCQKLTSEVLPELVKNNPDIEFYQYFVYGSNSDIDSFYATIEQDFIDNVYILLDNPDIDEWLSDNNFKSVPFTVMVDSTGKISLCSIGYYELSHFEQTLDLVSLNLGDMKITKEGYDNKTISQFMKEQAVAIQYIQDLEEIDVPKDLLEN